MIRLGKLEGTLLFSFFLLFSFSLLYIFRSFDNNTLVSWKWVFGAKGFTSILPYLLSGIVLSLFISLYIPLEKYPLPVLTIIAGCSVVPLWSEPELMLDSGRYFLQAKSLAENGTVYFFQEWGEAIPSWTDLPLIPFLYGLILEYGNESRIGIQIYNTIIFILTVILTYKIGETLWNRELGFYGGLLLAGIPYLLTQVPQMLVDIHAMFFHVLAVYCFVTAVRATDLLTLCFSVMTIVAATFVKYSLWPMLAVLPLSSLVLYSEKPHASMLRRTALILATAVLIAMTIISCRLDVFTEQLRILINYQHPALNLWGEGIISSFLFQCHPFIAILAMYALARAAQSRDRRLLIVLFYLLLIIVLQIRRVRYLIPLLPFITLMASYGLSALKEVQVRRYAAMLVLTSSLTVAHAVYFPFFLTTSMMNIKQAGEAIDELDGDLVEVAVQPQDRSEGSTFAAIPLLDLFTDKKIISRQNWPHTPPASIPVHSPLLFTWNMSKPFFYAGKEPRGQKTALPLVILSSLPASNDDYRHLRGTFPPAEGTLFARYSEVFRYRTLATIYN